MADSNVNNVNEENAKLIKIIEDLKKKIIKESEARQMAEHGLQVKYTKTVVISSVIFSA
jgi:hypothetical protein